MDPITKKTEEMDVGKQPSSLARRFQDSILRALVSACRVMRDDLDMRNDRDDLFLKLAKVLKRPSKTHKLHG